MNRELNYHCDACNGQHTVEIDRDVDSVLLDVILKACQQKCAERKEGAS